MNPVTEIARMLRGHPRDLTVTLDPNPSTQSIRLSVFCDVHGIVDEQWITDREISAATHTGELRPDIPERCPKCADAESVLDWMKDERP